MPYGQLLKGRCLVEYALDLELQRTFSFSESPFLVLKIVVSSQNRRFSPTNSLVSVVALWSD